MNLNIQKTLIWEQPRLYDNIYILQYRNVVYTESSSATTNTIINIVKLCQ